MSGKLGARVAPATGAGGTFLSEGALVEAARALDHDAWSEIYDRHYDRVYSYLYFRLRNREVAEDLAADVFVRALAGIHTFSYRGTPILAWLFRIAHNVAADHRKALARRNGAEAGGVDLESEPAEDGVEDEAVRRQDVREALAHLTADQQQVLYLRFYVGMSNAEAAAVMRRREGAVKALQVRALKTLRRVMDDGIKDSGDG